MNRKTLVLMIALTGLTMILVGRLNALAVERTTYELSGRPNSSRTIKIENNRVLFWVAKAVDRREDQIEIFSRSGKKLVSLNPFSSVAQADMAGIWDVSVGSSGLIAVAADYLDNNYRNAASLFIYKRTGELAKALFLPAHREIRKLEVDPDENIWALGFQSGGKPPETVPIIVRYNRNGDVTGEFLPRSEFPADAVTTLEREGLGAPAMGMKEEHVWFWLPASRKFVTVGKTGKTFQILDTGMPPWPGPDQPTGIVLTEIARMFRLPSGNLIGVARFQDSSKPPKLRAALYEWNVRNTEWKQVRGDQRWSRAWLCGLDGDEMALAVRPPNATNSLIELEWVPAPVR